MKFIFHYSVENFTNTYVIGPIDGGDAILIDPCVLDVPLLEKIESNNFTIKWILITRCQPYHTRGLRTIKKVYDAEIYSRQNSVLEFACHVVKAGTHLQLGGFRVDVISFPEYSHDAALYKIGNWIFCGDVISAGKPGKTTNPYATANLSHALERRFFTWQDDLLIFPGEGPPTLMRGEKLFNLVRKIAGLEIQESGEFVENPEESAP